jgi:hypothetical protein
MEEAAVRTPPAMEPLKLSCTKSDCAADLHCFRESRRRAHHPEGSCRSCGATLVDWERVRRLDLQDTPNTFESLKKEWIRHHFWHEEVDLHARKAAVQLEPVPVSVCVWCMGVLHEHVAAAGGGTAKRMARARAKSAAVSLTMDQRVMTGSFPKDASSRRSSTDRPPVRRESSFVLLDT